MATGQPFTSTGTGTGIETGFDTSTFVLHLSSRPGTVRLVKAFIFLGVIICAIGIGFFIGVICFGFFLAVIFLGIFFSIVFLGFVIGLGAGFLTGWYACSSTKVSIAAGKGEEPGAESGEGPQDINRAGAGAGAGAKQGTEKGTGAGVAPGHSEGAKAQTDATTGLEAGSGRGAEAEAVAGAEAGYLGSVQTMGLASVGMVVNYLPGFSWLREMTTSTTSILSLPTAPSLLKVGSGMERLYLNIVKQAFKTECRRFCDWIKNLLDSIIKETV